MKLGTYHTQRYLGTDPYLDYRQQADEYYQGVLSDEEDFEEPVAPEPVEIPQFMEEEEMD